MKNKVLATLLAVCLFAGLAVPAFASTTSSVAGDGSKVTKMEFLKSEYTLKQDEEKDFTKELRVYESDSKLVIDYQQITWELEGQGTNFQLSDGAKVVAVNETGSAKLIAKDDQSGKVVATTTIKAAPNPSKRSATSFKYANQTDMKIPVGYNAEDYTFKVLPITTGNYWTDANKQAVDDAVKADINAALGTLGYDSTKSIIAVPKTTTASFDVVLFSGTSSTAVASTPVMTFKNAAGKDVTITGNNVPKNSNIQVVGSSFRGKSITIDGTTYVASTRDAANKQVVTFTATVTGQRPSSVTDIVAINPTVTAGTGSTITLGYGLTNTAGVTAVDGATETEALSYGVIAAAAPNKDNELVYTIPGGALREVYATLVKENYNKKTSVTTKATMTDRDGNAPKEVTAKTNIQFVAAKAYETVAIAPNKTIAVGETFDLGATLKKGASNANVHGKITSWTEEYYNDSAVANDYAIVDEDGVVLGVAVGKNKIAVTMENGKTAYATIEVVKKGATTTPDGTVTTVLSNWTPKMAVGETANIVVKAVGKVTYTSLNEAVATVDAAGKLTAVKEGVAKIKVQEEGKKEVYVTVTVGATTTKPSDKPTDVPQTAVVALTPLF